jgi:hypothetical protein
VFYVEPGGHYELDAEFPKPVVACIVGRWKAKLTRAVGHAGALAGGDDHAAAKERWFMEKFGVDGVFTPENPVFSPTGAVVTNIAHIPAALTAVMRENGVRPDFAPEGSLALKPWFGSSQGLALPPELDLPVVEATPPHNGQIAQLEKQLGAVFPRQVMRDASGASQMDPKTQVTSLHGVSMLEAARNTLEANLCLALLREAGGENDRALVNTVVGAEVNLYGTPVLAAAEAARDAGNSPSGVLAAAAALVGPRGVEGARRAVQALMEGFAQAGLKNALDEAFDLSRVPGGDAMRALLVTTEADPKAERILAALHARSVRSVFLRYLEELGGYPTADAVLAAAAATLGWGPLMRKRVSRLTVENLPWWIRLFGTLIGASVPAELHEPDRFCGLSNSELLGARSLTEVACAALLGEAAPNPAHLFVFQTLVGLLLSNGPGTISAQGAKGAVAADGPETPERVQLNKATVGFLSHSGFAHGGNGYEGIAFVVEQFRNSGLGDPGNPGHGVDLKALAARYVADYANYKSAKKSAGSLKYPQDPGRQPSRVQRQARQLRPP